jgi:hypothetical protein
MSDQSNFTLDKTFQVASTALRQGLSALETFFYSHEVPQTETNPKQHLENANDDGYLHLISIHKNDFVFCYLKQ